MRRKQIGALCLVLAMLFMAVPGMSVLASGGTELGTALITPYYTNTSQVQVGLSFSGTAANCTSAIIGLSGTTKITATLSLYRVSSTGSLTLLKSWSASSSTMVLNIGQTYAASKGYTYRLSVSAQVTRNGSTESVSNFVDRAL